MHEMQTSVADYRGVCPSVCLSQLNSTSRGPNLNYAKVGHKGSGSGSSDLLLIFGPPRISSMAEAGQCV